MHEADMGALHLVPSSHDASDESLMRQLAAGHQEALGPLYSRYAPLIFSMAAQSLDRAGAEEIVQEVFLAVWRKAATFDPQRGSFRPWVLQISHLRIVNELRRRGRRPQLEADPDGLRLADVPDRGPDPAEVAWAEYRRSAVRSALETLRPPQRQALGLAFLEELTHEQVAAVLNVPLGTAKTRIRSGLQKLREHLAPVIAAIALVGTLAALGVHDRAEQVARQRNERALQLVTASDIDPIRLTAAPGVSEDAHGVYRGRADATVAVMTLSNLPPLPSGRVYQAWALSGGRWTSLGIARPDGADGSRVVLIAEGPELGVPPDALQVTLEPVQGSATPTGPVVVRWPAR